MGAARKPNRVGEPERTAKPNSTEKLTPAEWEIMEAVWSLGGETSVRDVVDHAYPGGEKAYTTVQTIMNTLTRKRLLRRRKVGLVNFYQPTCTRAQMARAETDALVQRIFGGSVPALANTLLSRADLDQEELAQIRRLLEERERELGSSGEEESS
jgi:BlaI family penicillinase repressor